MLEPVMRAADPPKLFISYSRKNQRKVERLARDLTTEGYIVWFDDWSILAGDSLIEEIQTGIDSADYVLFCLSAASLKSVWVREEVQSALARALRRRRPKLIPLMLETCEVPTLLAHRKYVDFRNDFMAGYLELKRALVSKASLHTPAATTHRFTMYDSTTSVKSHGGCVIETTCDVIAIGSPLKSLQVPFHVTLLPGMPRDNIRCVGRRSSLYRVETVTRGKDYLLLQIQFFKPVRPGDRPLRLSYTISVVKCYPSTKSEVLRMKKRGVPDWDTIWDGVLLPVPADRLFYRLQLNRRNYETPHLRVAAKMGGGSDRLETERVRSMGRIDLSKTTKEYYLDCEIPNLVPGIFYGAEWAVL